MYSDMSKDSGPIKTLAGDPSTGVFLCNPDILTRLSLKKIIKDVSEDISEYVCICKTFIPNSCR